jgi:GntR family transcriptional repressor for pyruvate dehydrogenase complex
MTRRSVADGAVERIQAMILGGEIAVGERMASQTEMSARLGISRATLREALSTLETLGFLSIEPGRGTFVVSDAPTRSGALSRWRFGPGYSEREVFQTRLALERAIAAEAARRIDLAALAGLRAATDGMRGGWRSQDLIGVIRHDRRFHELIVASCGNRMMRDLYDGARIVLQETQSHPIPVTRRDRAEASAAEHDAIADALHARDADAAAAAMDRHIRNTAAGLGLEI